MPSDLVEIIKEAIVSAARCGEFYAEYGDPCDGLNGCEECLTLTALKVIDALNAD